MPSVVQDWLSHIPLRMQSVLLLGLRGPDTHRAPNVKLIQRWLRGLTFRPGNPDNVREFMTDLSSLPKLVEKGPLAQELEFCTQHFYSHLMHALQVVGCKHPDYACREAAFGLYEGMCNLMHLPIEGSRVVEHRLQDRAWPGGRQPEDFAEAIQMLHWDGEDARALSAEVTP